MRESFNRIIDVADYRQSDMFGASQKDMFADSPIQEKPKVERKFGLDAEAARYYLEKYVNDFSELQSWPWERQLVEKLHTHSFPLLLGKLSDPQEISEWKAKLKVECDRLDAATQWAA